MVRERQHKYAQTERGRATAARYEATPEARVVRNRANAAWKARHREVSRPKNAARERVRRAVLSGQLVKQPCPCGEVQVQAHHPNGYDGAAALDVVWLCSRHHAEAHR